MLYLGLGVCSALFAIVAFLPVYFGAETAGAIISVLPEQVLAGLSGAGRMMPAIGFAMLLKIMLKKRSGCLLLYAETSLEELRHRPPTQDV